MNQIISFLLGLMAIRSAFNNFATAAIIHRLRRSYASQPANLDLLENRRIVIVLRVMSEQSSLTEAIRYLEEQIAERRNFEVIVVGTVREREASEHNPTVELARHLTADKMGFTVLEADDRGGSHASQTNYACESISSDPESTWVLMVDVDSRFSAAGLSEMIEAVNQDHAIIQQSAVFLLNYRVLGFLQRAHALYQSRWTISHEIKRIYLHNTTKMSVAHLVGHGLCIKLATLRYLKGLPTETPIEDVHLGFYVIAKNLPIRRVETLELGETPPTTWSGIKQEYGWSHAAMMYPAYAWWLRFHFPATWEQHRLKVVFVALQGLISYINWLVSSWLILGMLCLASTGTTLAAIVLLAYLLEYVQCALFFCERNWIPAGDVLLSPLLGLAGALRRSVGADAALLATLLGCRTKKFKTPHDSAAKSS